MKELLKNLGLILILAGTIFLGIVIFSKQQTNTQLLISMFMIVGGLLAHIVISKYVD